MQRMVSMIIAKQADIGMPMLAIKNQDQINKLPYDYSTDKQEGGVTFILYTNKSKPIDMESLKKGNPNKYNIESDVSNINLFDFTTLPSYNIEGSFRKVESGRIDGYIMGQISSDPVLKSLNLKNVKRQFFETYNTIFILQKGSKGSAVDKFLSEGLKKINASKKLYDEFVAPAKKSVVYDDWQP
jgi:polar amino acid transport system substrate-binding protein